jgi:hypothetical protein
MTNLTAHVKIVTSAAVAIRRFEGGRLTGLRYIKARPRLYAGKLNMRIALLLVLLALPFAAAAQDRAPGHVAARAFAVAPAPLAFHIEAGENTDENMAVAARIADEAAARGIGVQPQGAALVLRFDTEVRTNPPAQRQTFSRPGARLADPDSGTPSPPESRDEVTDMLSSRGDGLIGRRPLSGSSYGRMLRYVINASLEDRNGRRLWQGHVSYDTAEPDRRAMFVALAPMLVEQIGQNVQERAFRLD